MIPCLFRVTLGVRCPGCGLTTATRRLLRGDFSGAAAQYPMLIPVGMLLAYGVLTEVLPAMRRLFAPYKRLIGGRQIS